MRRSHLKLSPNGKAVRRRIYKNIGIAVKKFRLIEEEDKIILGFSGGEDSFTLLDYFYNFMRTVPFSIEFKIIMINMDFPQAELEKVKNYITENYNIPIAILENNIPKIVTEKMEQHRNSCVLCSRLRRGFLYDYTRNSQFNKLALAHNGDDIIETLMLNIFYNGKIKGMPPNFLNNEKDITLIRPLYYVLKKDISVFSKEMNFPVIKSSCPLAKYKGNKREKMKKILDIMEIDFDRIRNNALKSMEKIEERFLP